MSPPPKPKAPTALMAALFLLLAPTALAGERTQPAPRVAQAQPAPTAPAEQVAPTALAEEQAQPALTVPAEPQPQPTPRIAQAQPALPPTGDGPVTKDDLRWSHGILRDEIRANRDQINALYIAVVTGLVAIVIALLGLIAVFISRKTPAPTESAAPKTALPRPTSA